MDLKHLIFLTTRFSQQRSPLDKKVIHRSGQSVAQESDIMWLGEAWICGKKLKHYPACCRNKVKIHKHAIVWILGSWERTGCLGYVEDMYESQEEEQMVQIRKLLFREDFEGRKPKFYPLYREVLITSIVEHISAFDVDSLDSVPAPCYFHKCEESLPLILWLETFICCKELKDSSIISPRNPASRVPERSKVHQTGRTREPAQLEEWVPIAREAASHEQGVPCASWLTAWPCPKWDSSGFPFEVSARVDARWFDGWWEGGKKVMGVERKNMRESKDWLDNRWIHLRLKLN